MTNRALKLRLYWVAAGVGLCLIASLFEYSRNAFTGSTFISSNATLFALLFAAYMAFLFQQRSKAVDDLRRWWSEISQAKSEVFLYCDKENPSEEDFLKAYYKLSTAMDTLRLIYCNVEITEKNRRGLYPFEQVRDMVDVTLSIAPTRNSSVKERGKAKACLDIIFRSLRHAIQDEASSAPPDHPVLYESKERENYRDLAYRITGIDVERIRGENSELQKLAKAR